MLNCSRVLIKKVIEMIDDILEFFGLSSPSAKNIKNDILRGGFTRRKVTKLLRQKDNSVFIGKLKKKKLFISASDRACVIGPPGTGKTTFMINQIYHWIETGNNFVCLDIKPEIYDITKAKLKEKGYRCMVYNPTQEAHKYDFIGDLDSLESIAEVANSFIYSESNNSVFAETARDLLNAVILHIRTPTKKNPDPKPSLSDVYDFIVEAETMKELLTNLGHSNSDECRAIARSLSVMADSERLLGSVFATFVSNMRFLRLKSIRDSLSADGFSLEYLKKNKVALFLQFEESSQNTLANYFSVMVGHILRYLIIHHNDRNSVLLLLDEIGNAGVVQGLASKLNTIRSRNMPTWMYWQSVEQMQKYGNSPGEGANTILGACDLNMVFRLNDNSSASYFSAKVGTQDVVKVTVTGNVSTRTMTKENIIEPHELMNLNEHEVLCSYRGINWLGAATPFFQESKK